MRNTDTVNTDTQYYFGDQEKLNRFYMKYKIGASVNMHTSKKTVANDYHQRQDVLIGRSKSPTRGMVLNVPPNGRDNGKEETRSVGSGSGGDAGIILPGASCDPNEYNFTHKRRGVFMVLNNKTFEHATGRATRKGTDMDAERIEERFQDLGFEVRRYDDLSVHQMTSLMYRTAAEDHSDADCFACAVLSYGVDGRVYARDATVSLDMLILPFKGDRCSTLVGKPKIFIIQACRDVKLESDTTETVGHPENDSMAVAMRTVPVEADFIIAYSTVPGKFSWRRSQGGSWFIQAICLVLENQGSKTELMHIFTQVNRIVAYDFQSCHDEDFLRQAKYMPCIVSMLTRYVYFRPKKSHIIS